MSILKKITFLIFFNSSLLIVLMIGLQNNSKKSKVDLMINETVNLPIGFIFGASFISGSLTGGLIFLKDK
mgnify:CR=1 FL=1